MGNTGLITVAFLASVWQLSMSSNSERTHCTSDENCSEGEFCVPEDHGSKKYCESCDCMYPSQCRIDSVSRNKSCDCSGSDYDGPYCKCRKCVGSCPDGSVRFRGTCSCYYTHYVELTWHEAFAACKERNEMLVKIKSDEENEFVADFMRNSAHHVWIGANDIATEGVWKWADDSYITYENWRGQSPYERMETKDCAQLHTPSGKWNDIRCEQRSHYVCERDP